jgi:uncharacterized membrane protein HdeD (DUF308 family)
MSINTPASASTFTRVSTFAPALRKLYFFRFAFAIVWAAVIFASGSVLTPLTISLLILYPVFDLAAAIFDARSDRTKGPVGGLYINMVLSLVAAIGLVIAVSFGEGTVFLVWGAWAITAGIVQLIVAIGRRSFGGQIPLILAGAISVVAGAGFISLSSSSAASLTFFGGYAVLGGIFFLISALRLRRSPKVN